MTLIEQATRGALLVDGHVTVLGDPESRRALYLIVTQLRAEGHAVVYADTILAGKVVSATANHYLTCSECKRQRDKGWIV